MVLHPLDGVVDHPVTIEHTDGSVEESRFPVEVDPACPFQDIRAVTHEIRPGVRLTCRMEGDAFEMEDHRNWLDASFKTYIRPLAKPWPYTMSQGRGVPASRDDHAGRGAAERRCRDQRPGHGHRRRRNGDVRCPNSASRCRRGGRVRRWSGRTCSPTPGPPSWCATSMRAAGHDRATIAEYAEVGEAVGAPLVLEAVVPCEDASGQPTDDLAVLHA